MINYAYLEMQKTCCNPNNFVLFFLKFAKDKSLIFQSKIELKNFPFCINSLSKTA